MSYKYHYRPFQRHQHFYFVILLHCNVTQPFEGGEQIHALHEISGAASSGTGVGVMEWEKFIYLRALDMQNQQLRIK
jgi:hypothetical protein